jgi:predicted RNase H-like HicB family nuclease
MPEHSERNGCIMLIEYVEEALRRARYEIIEDEEPFYGEVEALKGVWATGKTLEECRSNLKDVIEGWILLSIKKGLPIPKLGGYEITEIQEVIA